MLADDDFGEIRPVVTMASPAAKRAEAVKAAAIEK